MHVASLPDAACTADSLCSGDSYKLYQMHTYKLLHLCMLHPCRMQHAQGCICMYPCRMHHAQGAYACILAGCTMHRYTYNLYAYAYKVCTPIVRYLISRLTIYIYIYIPKFIHTCRSYACIQKSVAGNRTQDIMLNR